MTKLRNQSEFTQIAYVGGVNAGSLAGVDGKDGEGTLGTA